MRFLSALIVASVLFASLSFANDDKKEKEQRIRACIDFCNSIYDRPGYALRACVAKCLQDASPASAEEELASLLQ